MHEASSSSRITPWVGRLLAINAIVLLLTETLFTAPAIVDWLSFDPALALRERPWTFVTYMFMHGGMFHLAANGIALFAFGPAVERQLGSSRFIFYYFYCGLGAAILSIVLAALMPIAPFIGASGAVLGVALAFARFYPEAELIIFPLPFPIKARVLVWLLASLDLVGAVFGSGDGIAHVAHLGGLLFGMLYFGIQQLAHPIEGPTLPPMQPRGIPVGAGRAGRRESDHAGAARERAEAVSQVLASAAPTLPDPAEVEAEELNRVLDKIHATGIDSLSLVERAFLDDVARRRRGQAE
ncbi:MAG TPA: rhomboid family intramembrane serine protease [Gemmatimonadales bacterium]|nr:rhomboid family intramembrane serine protease [Gemmatimonadales bacterium]